MHSRKPQPARHKVHSTLSDDIAQATSATFCRSSGLGLHVRPRLFAPHFDSIGLLSTAGSVAFL